MSLSLSSNNKTNIIIFSGNGQNKNKTNFKYANETIEIVNKQTYLGTEMTSSGRCAYAMAILSKKATKIVFTIKRLLSNIDSSAVETRKELFDALFKPELLYGCEIWRPELLFIRHILIKVQLSKFTLNSVNKH